MIDAPIAFAFTAGLLATVNPCGFAMLPAYLSYFLGIESGASPGRSPVGRALTTGGAVSAGFVVVFALAGSLVSAGIRSFLDYVPWMAIVIGVALVGLGVALLAGRHVRVALPQLDRRAEGRGLRSAFVFGISYAIASLSCTLPVFLTAVVSTVTRANFVSGVISFLAYGLGMSVLLVALTLALALAKDSLVRHLKRAVRHVERAAGALLVVAGGYIVYYWVFYLGTDVGTERGSGPARFVERLSFDVADWIDRHALRLAILLAGLVAAVGAYTLTRRILEGPQPRSDQPPGGPPPAAPASPPTSAAPDPASRSKVAER
ncbi:MAG: cytochrome c biogenesis CcdA family protein [Actinomycetota bacterium]